MNVSLLILLAATTVVVAVILVIVLQARRIRYLQRRVDVHAEALRMIAEHDDIEDLPTAPQQRHLHVVRDTLLLFATVFVALTAWTHRHAGPFSALAAGVVAAGLAGLLLVTGRPPAPAPLAQAPTSDAPVVPTSPAVSSGPTAAVSASTVPSSGDPVTARSFPPAPPSTRPVTLPVPPSSRPSSRPTPTHSKAPSASQSRMASATPTAPCLVAVSVDQAVVLDVCL